MAIHSFADIEHREANTLCQLHAVDFDLSSVVDLCESVFNQVAASQHGHIAAELHDVYTVTILIRFSRATGSGKRHAAQFSTAERASLPEELDQAWHYFDAIRDKHIAHSVNAFEETRLRFMYTLGKETEATITALSTSGFRVVGLNGDQVDQMKRLCLELRKILQQRIKAEEARLLPILQAESPMKWIEKGMKPLGQPDHSQVRKPRKSP